MATHDALMEIVSHLQQQQAPQRDRRELLDFARKRARARLGLLFRYDADGQRLLLIEHAGRAPRNAIPIDGVELPIDGLFGTGLQQSAPGLMKIAAGDSDDSDDNDQRGLPAERAWIWRGGPVMLCPIGTASREQRARGVLALCAEPRSPEPVLSSAAEQDVLLCASLLANYLDEADPSPPPPPDAHKGHPYMWDDHPARTQAGGTRDVGIVSSIYDVGLMSGGMTVEQVCQAVLARVGEAVQAASGGLWLYSPSQGQYLLRALSDEDRSYVALVQDELAQMAREQKRGREAAQREGLRVVTWSAQRMVILHPLECAGQRTGQRTGQRIGAFAFALEGRQDLSGEERFLLESMCHAAAVVIAQAQQREAERQTAIDGERGRIARDIHDGAVQQIAQVLHTLEYAGRVVERQPEIALQEIRQAQEGLRESLNSLRQSIASLLPVQLERASFDEALRDLLDDLSGSDGSGGSAPAITVHYEKAHLKHLPLSLEVPVYRLVQEALNNARSHSRATQIALQIQALSGMLVVQVSDNGSGFDVEQVRRNARGQQTQQGQQGQHFGLRSMQERVEQAGGTLTITSAPGEGTTLKARFPLPALASALTGREREVLRLLVAGSTNRMIAEQLFVSVETVKSHMHHIMQKLGARDRTQAAVLAARQQWV